MKTRFKILKAINSLSDSSSFCIPGIPSTSVERIILEMLFVCEHIFKLFMTAQSFIFSFCAKLPNQILGTAVCDDFVVFISTNENQVESCS